MNDFPVGCAGERTSYKQLFQVQFSLCEIAVHGITSSQCTLQTSWALFYAKQVFEAVTRENVSY